ncbi:MAG: type II toxin-antitoxin system PemK/MazF family toxin [Armatimonadetes bacterium]|nr:type II toxin-antitoxin system PemK/MazF family toxin [Armatimonadota bacterium]
MRRGEIWWADLSEPHGSEPGYRRPVLIVQSDPFNVSHIRTVVVLAITSNLAIQAAPGNVLVQQKHTGLAKDSVVNVSQVFAVDRSRLTERIGRLPSQYLDAIDAGMRLVLGL